MMSLEIGTTVSNLNAAPTAAGLGAIGFFALVNGRGRHREVVLVSNRHVLLAHGARAGERIYRSVADNAVIRADDEPVAEILDEGAEANHRYRYSSSPAGAYFVDCATARVLVERGVRAATRIPTARGLIRGAARLHPLDVAGRRSPRVRKIGGATGVTEGRVVDASLSLWGVDGQVRKNNIAIWGEGGRPFAEAGDSGALVVDERDQAVGIVWGRSDRDAAIAYACHIHPVLDRLAVTMLAGGLS